MQSLNLNLGCGTDIKPTTDQERWINIDIYDRDPAQPWEYMKYDIRNRLPFEMNTVDFIYACHCVEHFTRFEWAVMKKDWYRVLKGGGIIEVRCPDLEIACQKFATSEYRYHGVVSIHDMIYGSQDVSWQMHHQGFDKGRISKELQDEGFSILECYNTLPSNDWQLVCRAQK